MNTSDERVHDVIVVGAGPAGLMTANLLGADGLDVLVLEAADDILQYPRAIGMDDESLRTFQAAGLVDALLPHIDPGISASLLDSKGRLLVESKPAGRPYGWPRNNMMIQPLADKVLLDGLDRFSNVEVRFGTAAVGTTAKGDHQEVQTNTTGSEGSPLRARFVVGADGGSSDVRKDCGISFEGTTSRYRWLVVDIADDPIGTLHATTICDPREPIVNIKLPHGVRRLEFRINDEAERDEEATQGPGLLRRLGLVMPRPEEAKVIRARVYWHHSRVAASFRKGRVLLAGDAAHVMPVWQGQGYNTGLRDAANLAWKLSTVVRGLAGESLLDTYDLERRPHGAAMVKVSTDLGRLITQRNRVLAKARDLFFRGLRKVPFAYRHVLEGGFKPMPGYTEGALAEPEPGNPRPPALGKLMEQPRVITDQGAVDLDEVLGTGFALLSWTTDPMNYMDSEAQEFWRRIDARVIVAVPAQQLDYRMGDSPDHIVVGDDGALMDWFTNSGGSIVAIRPDRIVALVSRPQNVSTATARLASALSYRSK